MKRFALLGLLVLAGCGGSSSPHADPKQIAVQVLDQIVHNRYADAWDGMLPADQAVAGKTEYVTCESRSPVLAVPTTVKVVGVKDVSIGLGNRMFVQSKEVDLRLGFTGGFHLVHAVHLVAAKGKWTWILPPTRYRQYKANTCPTDPGSTPPPQTS